tara:strand:- start:67 stop:1836 length:1770 start_codon:yes stop_codon:yes gene_type:complete
MPQNTFLGTGILDGQIVEANQISQSVDAFTGAKDYRITLTGSMELSGSFFMSGSFINEYTGQFSTLGLGVAAPTAPTMLYIKDTSAGGDPAIIMEATTGADSARLRLKNTDIEYDLGVFGSFDDDFRIVQDETSTPKYPFIVEKNTVSYTLYANNESVGVGLGSNTPAIMNSLDAGSLQAAGRVSGSSMRAGTISASAAGENIHGTASYATYIETAVTASYVKAENVDFYYSISQQINSGGRIAAVTGSFDNAQTDSDSGYSIGKNAGGYTKIISGSAGGNLFFGSVPEQNFIKMTGNGSTIELDSGGEVYLKNDVFTPGTITISGSLSGDRKLVVGPNNTSGTINARSSSLLVNSLEFNENSEASCVGNYNSSGTSKLILSAGGGPSNKALTISASRDVEFHGLAELNSTQIGTNELSHTGSLFKLNQSGTDCDRIMQQQTYRMAFKTLAAGSQVTGILWQIFCASNATELPRLNLTSHNGGVVMIEADITATSNDFNDEVASWKIITTRNIGSNGTTGDVNNPAGNDQTVVHKAVTSGIQVNDPNIDTSGATSRIVVIVNGDSNSGTTLKYGGFIKLTYMGYGENVC